MFGAAADTLRPSETHLGLRGPAQQPQPRVPLSTRHVTSVPSTHQISQAPDKREAKYHVSTFS